MNIPVTPNIALTKLLPTDLPAVLQHLQAPCIATTTVGIPYPYSAEEFDTMLARAEAELEYGHSTYVGLREQDGSFIGAINFREVIGEGVLEIGFRLAKPWHVSAN